MKEQINTLHIKVDKLSDKVDSHDNEIVLLREFKHDTNGHLHVHNGKLNIIENQHISIVASLDRLTSIVEDAIKKISGLMALKSMIMGGAVIFIPTVTGMFFIFQWYLKSKGIE